MELVQFLNYIFSVAAVLLAGYAVYSVLELEKLLTVVRNQNTMLARELYELRKERKAK